MRTTPMSPCMGARTTKPPGRFSRRWPNQRREKRETARQLRWGNLVVLPSLENGKSKNCARLGHLGQVRYFAKNADLRLFVRLVSLFGHHASLSAMGGHALEVAVPA